MTSDATERDPVEELAEEFLRRVRNGESTSPAEYASQHPEFAERIEELFPTLLMMEQIGSIDPETNHRKTPTSHDHQSIPQQLGDYRIVREIGHGGMGIVYEAIHDSLNRHVALKILPASRLASKTQLDRFQLEARAAAKLHHTNIVPVFDVGEHEGVHYFAMQFISGQSLDLVLSELRTIHQANNSGSNSHRRKHHVLQNQTPSIATESSDLESGQSSYHGELNSESPNRQDGPNYYRKVAELIYQVAMALDFAHANGVVHRDIKPSNLLLDTSGRLWISDFGLAKFGEHDLTQTGDIVGTLRYMAPERLNGKSTPQSDIYSLGATLFELLTLQPPITGANRLRLIRDISRQEPARPRSIDPRIPLDLETIATKAIEKDPDRRYQTALELAEDIRNFLSDHPVNARRTTLVEKTWRWCRRNPSLATMILTITLLVSTITLGAAYFASIYRNQRDVVIRQSRDLSREKDVAETAKDAAVENLWKSHMAFAQACRSSHQDGRRSEALRAISQAAAIHPKAELRNEAIACMSLYDLKLAQDWRTQRTTRTTASACFSPAFEFYAIQTKMGTYSTLNVIRTLDHQTISELTIEGRALTMDFSFDGSKLFVRSTLGKTTDYVWDWKSERALFQVTHRRHNYPAIDLDRSGRFLALGRADKTIQLIDLLPKNPTPKTSIEVSANCVRFSPHGRFLAACNGSTLTVIDVNTKTQTKTVRFPDYASSVAWSHDGSLIAIGCYDSNVYILDHESGKQINVLRGHARPVDKISFHPSKDLLATTGWDGKTIIWDPYDSAGKLKIAGYFRGFCQHDESFATVDGRQLSVWKFGMPQHCRRLAAKHAPNLVLSHLAIGLNGRVLVASSDRSFSIWDLETNEQIGTAHNASRWGITFDASGNNIITSDSQGILKWPVAKQVQEGILQSISIGPPVRIVEGRSSGEVSFSKSGEFVHGSSNGARLCSADGNLIGAYYWPQAWFVALSPNAEYLAAGNFHRDFGTATCVWHRDQRWSPILKPDHHGSGQVLFSPDGKWFASSVADRIQFWRISDWQLTKEIRHERAGSLGGSMAFTDDSQLVAIVVSRFKIHLLRLTDFKLLAELVCAPSPARVSDLVFTPDGRKLVAACARDGLRVWNLAAINGDLRDMNLAGDWKTAGESTDLSVQTLACEILE